MSVKKDLLAALEDNRDIPISGQMIADQLGVSRNAVSKAINTLKCLKVIFNQIGAAQFAVISFWQIESFICRKTLNE